MKRSSSSSSRFAFIKEEDLIELAAPIYSREIERGERIRLKMAPYRVQKQNYNLS
jgi:hypothetical protein